MVIAAESIDGTKGALRELLEAIRDKALVLREVQGSKAPKTVAVVGVPEWVPAREWTMFLSFRKEIGAELTETSVKVAVAKLDELRQQGHDPAKVLLQSIEKKWRGLFPLRSNILDKNEPFDRAAVAFNEVHGAVRVGRRPQQWRDPLTEHVVVQLGGWNAFLNMKTDDVPFRRRDFTTTFRALQMQRQP